MRHTENLQLWDRNQPEDIADILGTTAFKGYVNSPLKTLNGILVQQPKWFLPLGEEAKRLAEEICIEKLNKQWAGIPHEKLLNQSYRDQLNSLQILEQLALQGANYANFFLPVSLFRNLRETVAYGACAVFFGECL